MMNYKYRVIVVWSDEDDCYTWHGQGLRFLPPKSPNTGGL